MASPTAASPRGDASDDQPLQSNPQPVNFFHLLRMLSTVVFFIWWYPLLGLFGLTRLLTPLCTMLGISPMLLPFKRVPPVWSRHMLAIMGVRVEVEGNPKHPRYHVDVPSLFCYNHSSNLDALIVMATAPRVPMMVYKRELHMNPVGWMVWVYGNVAIDRTDRERAIQRLTETCEYEMRTRNIAVCIAPEGTRSRTGKVLPFKKGPFHIASNLQCSVVSLFIRGAFALWPPRQKLPSIGVVHVKYLPDVSAEGKSMEEVREETYQQYLKETESGYDLPKSSPAVNVFLQSLPSIANLLAVAFAFYGDPFITRSLLGFYLTWVMYQMYF